MNSPAENLKGLVLDGGWKVVEKIQRPDVATGGCFSCGYVVEKDGRKQGYLKALDYSRALGSPDPAKAFQGMVQAFNFERNLCGKCNDKKLKRVVSAIGDGKVNVEPDNPASVVQYLIFELAQGDIRTYIDVSSKFDTAWALRSLHHISTGLFELHGVGIAHQDLKPSNVLYFHEKGSKVADLGRAADKQVTGPCDEIEVAGDVGYAPPELLYGHVETDWQTRRFGCDAYLLGSMIVFFFGRGNMTGLLQSELDDNHHWRKWAGTFQEILPYVRDAFGRALTIFSKDVEEGIRDDLVLIVRELCEPDPKLRGHPQNRASRGNQYSLERYVSKFDLLARKAEYGLLGG